MSKALRYLSLLLLATVAMVLADPSLPRKDMSEHHKSEKHAVDRMTNGLRGGKGQDLPDVPFIKNHGVRRRWDECLGMDGEEAVNLIKTERPDLRKVILTSQGSAVTTDIRPDRVRVWVNEEGKVIKVPRVG